MGIAGVPGRGREGAGRAADAGRCGRDLPRPAQDKHGHIGVHPQKQPGMNYVGVVCPVGRLTSDRLRGLADIAARFGSGTLRLTVWQNLLITDIPDAALDAALGAIAALGLDWRATRDPRRAGRLHRQRRLQVRARQHQASRRGAGGLAGGAHRDRPADQHPPHRLPPFLRAALRRRYRPARRPRSRSARTRSKATTCWSAVAPGRSKSWAGWCARRWRSTTCRRCVLALLEAWQRERESPAESFQAFTARLSDAALSERCQSGEVVA